MLTHYGKVSVPEKAIYKADDRREALGQIAFYTALDSHGCPIPGCCGNPALSDAKIRLDRDDGLRFHTVIVEVECNACEG